MNPSQPDGDRRQELIESVLAGEIAADAPEVRALVATDPGFAEELAHLRFVQRSLDALGTDLDRDLQTPADPQLEAVLLAKLRQRQDTGPRAIAAPRRSRWLPPLLVALLLAALTGAWLLKGSGGEDPQHVAGGIAIETRPDGSLHFVYDLPPGGHYEVRVRAGADPLLPTTKVPADWRPPRDVVTRWPAVVEVTVEARLGDTKLAYGTLQWTPGR